eukprot:1142912-Pelagomonas_calceolata.AAC.21
MPQGQHPLGSRPVGWSNFSAAGMPDEVLGHEGRISSQGLGCVRNGPGWRYLGGQAAVQNQMGPPPPLS